MNREPLPAGVMYSSATQVLFNKVIPGRIKSLRLFVRMNQCTCEVFHQHGSKHSVSHFILNELISSVLNTIIPRDNWGKSKDWQERAYFLDETFVGVQRLAITSIAKSNSVLAKLCLAKGNVSNQFSVSFSICLGEAASLQICVEIATWLILPVAYACLKD